MKYFVSKGSSFGFYSDYIPSNIHSSVEEAEEWGLDQYDGSFTVWHVEDGEAIAD